MCSGAHSYHNYKELIGHVCAFDPDRNMVLDNMWNEGKKKHLTVNKAWVVMGKKKDLEHLCLLLLCGIFVSSSLGVLNVWNNQALMYGIFDVWNNQASMFFLAHDVWIIQATVLDVLVKVQRPFFVLKDWKMDWYFPWSSEGWTDAFLLQMIGK